MPSGPRRGTGGTDLSRWFLAIFLVTSSKRGISAMELQRQMGFGSYGTAWSWLHKIRKAMVRPGREPLALQVEADEYVFRFDRRTARNFTHRFARLIEQAVITPPLTYRDIVSGVA